MANVMNPLLRCAKTACLAAIVVPCVLSTLRGQSDTRPVVFEHARILLAGDDAKTIEDGTLIARNGEIVAVGPSGEVERPAGAHVVDLAGKTIMPGFVSAFSRAGLNPSSGRNRGNVVVTRGRRPRGSRGRGGGGGGSASNTAAKKVVDGLYADQEVFGELLERGVTTLALTPTGQGFPGLGAVLNPSGTDNESLTRDDDAFVFVAVARNPAVKKILKETLAKASEVVKERKKPKAKPEADKPKDGEKDKAAAAKKADEKKPEAKEGETPKDGEKPKPKPEPKPGEEPKPDDKKPAKPEAKKADPKKVDKKREKKKDPNLEVLADWLMGKRRVVLQIDSAADLLHWQDVLPEDFELKNATVVSTRWDQFAGTLLDAPEAMKKLGAKIMLLPPLLSTAPRTSFVTNPAKQCVDAGFEIAFWVGDDPSSVESLRFRLLELVRAGLDEDIALKAVTLTAAKALGVDKEVGTLAEGKRADVLVFDGHPLAPGTALVEVWSAGKKAGQDDA